LPSFSSYLFETASKTSQILASCSVNRISSVREVFEIDILFASGVGGIPAVVAEKERLRCLDRLALMTGIAARGCKGVPEKKTED
jgi:hypothetical protein